MPQDAFTIGYVADELSKRLVGGKISKIFQPSRDELSFIIYTRSGNVKLDLGLSAQNCRASLSSVEREAPLVAPNFCMLLRKHLQNAKTVAVERVGFERIIRFDFECSADFSDEKLSLYAEIMGKYSNAILCRDGIILGALKTNSIGENTKRLLFAGVKYELPAPQEKISPDDLPALEKAEFTGGDLAKFISDNIRGIAYTTARDIADYCGGKFDAKRVNSYIFGGQSAPCVIYEDGKPKDFKAVYFGKNAKKFDSVLDAQTAYYDEVISEKLFDGEKKRLVSALMSHIRKAEKRLSIIGDKLLECRDAETVKLKGELLTANIYAMPRGAQVFEAVNYYDENGGKIKIALDPHLTPAQNAQKYYKRYAKLKRAAQAVSVQKEQTESECDYLYSLLAHVESADSPLDLGECAAELISAGILKAEKKVKKKAPSPFRTYECGSFKILAGRNNIQNDRLLKSVSPEDIWLHTQGYHSAHVVIVTGGAKIPANVLEVAAQICAHYSDAKSGSKIPVDYTKRKFVKKPPARAAGYVVYTDYRTVLVDPDPHAALLKE